jgi:hypothetical protein
MKTYLITEQVQVAVKVEAENSDEAFDKYYEVYGKTFKQSSGNQLDKMYAEDSHRLRIYVADADGEFKEANE